jgi:hypothetical protein
MLTRRKLETPQTFEQLACCGNPIPFTGMKSCERYRHTKIMYWNTVDEHSCGQVVTAHEMAPSPRRFRQNRSVIQWPWKNLAAMPRLHRGAASSLALRSATACDGVLYPSRPVLSHVNHAIVSRRKSMRMRTSCRQPSTDPVLLGVCVEDVLRNNGPGGPGVLVTVLCLQFQSVGGRVPPPPLYPAVSWR